LTKDIIITQKDLIDALSKTEITDGKEKTNLPAMRAARNFLEKNSLNLASLHIQQKGNLANLKNRRQSAASVISSLIKPIQS
jgi:hypothetical protein